MTQFDDREKAEERIFVNKEELDFKIAARRNKLLGVWAAGLMGLNDDATNEYAASVVVSDLKEAGDDDVIAKIFGDLMASKVEITEGAIRRELDRLHAQARTEVTDA